VAREPQKGLRKKSSMSSSSSSSIPQDGGEKQTVVLFDSAGKIKKEFSCAVDEMLADTEQKIMDYMQAVNPEDHSPMNLRVGDRVYVWIYTTSGGAGSVCDAVILSVQYKWTLTVGYDGAEFSDDDESKELYDKCVTAAESEGRDILGFIKFAAVPLKVRLVHQGESGKEDAGGPLISPVDSISNFLSPHNAIHLARALRKSRDQCAALTSTVEELRSQNSELLSENATLKVGTVASKKRDLKRRREEHDHANRQIFVAQQQKLRLERAHAKFDAQVVSDDFLLAPPPSSVTPSVIYPSSVALWHKSDAFSNAFELDVDD
jgi:hypothetical protein